MMTEEDIYIGVVHNRLVYDSFKYELTIKALMKWDKDTEAWLDIDADQLYKIFPDRGLIIWSEAVSEIWRGHVLKFKICQNSKYIQNNFKKNAKLSVDKNYFYTLCEIIRLNFSGSEFDFRQALLDGKLTYNKARNSECFLHFNSKKYFGPFKFIENGKSRLNLYRDSLNTIQIRQINQINIIKPMQLNNRRFVDLSWEPGELLYYSNWQPKPNFVMQLINRLRRHLEKSTNSTFVVDLDETKNSTQQTTTDKAILLRLQEHESMNNLLQQEDIDSIVELLMAMEPFQSKLDAAKESQLEQCHEQIKAQAQQQETGLENKIEKLQQEIDNKRVEFDQLVVREKERLELKRIEKYDLENQVSNLKNQIDNLDRNLVLQQTRTNQVLDEFERSLNERFNQFAVEPTGMLAEALANDAFLQFVLGSDKKRLELGSSKKSSTRTPNFKIHQGPFFENSEDVLTRYCRRLEQVDLEKSLAPWTISIILSGIMPVLKNSTATRLLNVLANHLTYGRCFVLPLSPEIISIERLFSIGESSDSSSLGIIDTAILCAATHREILFMLVLDGLDRAPSQYFLDTLMDCYKRGFLDMPGDAFLSKRLKKIWMQHRGWEQNSLADDFLTWPANLLLTATVNGLADGFPTSNTAQGKIIEIDAQFQEKHLDIHPALIDQTAYKPTGEVAVKQWNEWREMAKTQDVSEINNWITSLPKEKQPDVLKKEMFLRLFAALCTLEQPKNQAISFIHKYLVE